MLESAEEEQLVLDHAPAAIHRIGIHVDFRNQRRGGKQFGRALKSVRRNRYAPSPWKSLAPLLVMVLNTVPTVLPNSGAKPLRHLLHFRHVDIGHRDQADAGAIALRVVAAIELIIDAPVEAVGVDLARHAEFRVGAAAHVGLKQNEIVRIARNQRQIARHVLAQRTAQVDAARLGDCRRRSHIHHRGRCPRRSPQRPPSRSRLRSARCPCASSCRTRRLHFHLISAQRQHREAVQARFRRSSSTA